MGRIGTSLSVHGVEVTRESDHAALIAYTVQEGDHVLHAGVVDPADVAESGWDALAIGNVSGNGKADHVLHGHDRGGGVRRAGG